jgi:DNA-binding cell septation regulator SpoVG
MEITRVKIALYDDEGIKAYATITIDDCFVIQGLRLTHSQKAIFFLCQEKRRLTVHTNQEVETHALRLCKPTRVLLLLQKTIICFHGLQLILNAIALSRGSSTGASRREE